MKKLLLFCLLYSAVAQAQKFPYMGLNRVRITQADRTILAEINPAKEEDTYTDRMYYWYSSNAIHTTQGGYSGKLLNGSYTEYYANKNLKEQGKFKNGLKTGTWKSWNDNGLLSEFTTWAKGIKQGEFAKYDEHGHIRQNGHYKENLLNGKVQLYPGTDSIQTLQYQAGQVVSGQLNTPSLWQKVKTIGRKPKETGTSTIPTPDSTLGVQTNHLRKVNATKNTDTTGAGAY